MSTAERITERKLFANGRVFVVPTKAKDVVTITGSVLGGSNYLPPTRIGIPALASGLFDAGTKKASKDALRAALAARGATLSFYTSGDRTGFSGSCLPEDVPFLLATAAECLGQANFLEKEIIVEREQLLGRLKEAKTNTRTQSANELSRLIYDEHHVNYTESDAAAEKSLKSTTRAQLLEFRSQLGAAGLVLAIVGDVAPAAALRAAERSFGSLKKGLRELPAKARNTKRPKAEEQRIEISGKANVDIFFGAVVPITLDDALYLPFMTVSDMLGGGFASHLMQTIRERDGLTYGIYTTPNGFQKGAEGAFRILATFAPELFDKGVAAIRKEMKLFFETGLTAASLRKKQDEFTGSYVVGLSSTNGLATALHRIGTEGKPLSYIDDYPNLIRAITLSDVREAAALIPHDKLARVAAGTFRR